MEAYISLFIKAVFIENLALAFFWECVHFLRYRKDFDCDRVRNCSDGCSGDYRACE